MNLEQGPRFATELATTAGFDFARERVLEQGFDFWAVAIVALGIDARARVHQKFHCTFNLRRTVFSFRVRHRRAIACGATLSHERVLMSDADATAVANVKVGARFAAPSFTRFEFTRTLVTGCHKRRFRRIVQVIQHHHRRVLSAAKRVKLKVITLAQGQKRLSRVKEFVLELLLFILLLLSN